jgi:hypothetical protein
MGNLEKAGTGRRFLALIIDWLMCLLISSLVGFGSRSISTLAIFFIEVSILTTLQQASAGQRAPAVEVCRARAGSRWFLCVCGIVTAKVLLAQVVKHGSFQHVIAVEQQGLTRCLRVCWSHSLGFLRTQFTENCTFHKNTLDEVREFLSRCALLTIVC